GCPPTPAAEAKLMIRPPPCRIRLNAAWLVRKVPRVFTANTCSHSSRVISSAVALGAIPAALTSTSTPPPQPPDSQAERLVHRRGIGDITDPASCPTASLTHHRVLRGVDIKTDDMGALGDVCRDDSSANAARAACHDDAFVCQLHGAALM